MGGVRCKSTQRLAESGAQRRANILITCQKVGVRWKVGAYSGVYSLISLRGTSSIMHI